MKKHEFSHFFFFEFHLNLSLCPFTEINIVPSDFRVIIVPYFLVLVTAIFKEYIYRKIFYGAVENQYSVSKLFYLRDVMADCLYCTILDNIATRFKESDQVRDLIQ